MGKFLRFISGLAVSVALTFLLELLFALIVKSFGLTSATIRPVNQVVKAVCILVATFIGVTEKGFILGGVAGVIYSVILTVVFGLIADNLALNLSFLLEIIFGILVGGIGGVLSVNLKNK